ncbi:Glucose-6-phosphate 1-dehydrogenase, partial [Haemophilus influenzae]
ADFEIWREDESEYDDFRQVKVISEKNLILRSDEDFWCIGKSIEKAELNQIDPVLFITHSIQQLQPLYDRCHQ